MLAGTATSIILGLASFRLRMSSTYSSTDFTCRRGLQRRSSPIVLTVSPVGLGRTYTGKDVVVATVEAKSILRAVTAEICREFENVSYWPSYELATRDDIFREDGRHVRQDSVALIVDSFIEAHRADVP